MSICPHGQGISTSCFNARFSKPFQVQLASLLYIIGRLLCDAVILYTIPSVHFFEIQNLPTPPHALLSCKMLTNNASA